jgi:hypothetical protein
MKTVIPILKISSFEKLFLTEQKILKYIYRYSKDKIREQEDSEKFK